MIGVLDVAKVSEYLDGNRQVLIALLLSLHLVMLSEITENTLNY